MVTVIWVTRCNRLWLSDMGIWWDYGDDILLYYIAAAA
jgi:hypothetical protein